MVIDDIKLGAEIMWIPRDPFQTVHDMQGGTVREIGEIITVQLDDGAMVEVFADELRELVIN